MSAGVPINTIWMFLCLEYSSIYTTSINFILKQNCLNDQFAQAVNISIILLPPRTLGTHPTSRTPASFRAIPCHSAGSASLTAHFRLRLPWWKGLPCNPCRPLRSWCRISCCDSLFPRPKGQVPIGNFLKLTAISSNRIDGILSSRIDARQDQVLAIGGPDRG